MAWDRIAVFLIIVLIIIVLTAIGKAIYRVAYEEGKKIGIREEHEKIWKAEDKARAAGYKDGVASVKRLVASVE